MKRPSDVVAHVATTKIRGYKMDVYGHTIDLARVSDRLKFYLDRGRGYIDISAECSHCGAELNFELDNSEKNMYVESMRTTLNVTPWSEPHGLGNFVNPFECPYQKVIPLSFDFEVTSGTIALGNDFRGNLELEPKVTPYFSYNGLLGDRTFIQHRYESLKYLTGRVGNTHISFTSTDGGIDVVEGFGIKNAIHEFSTELWWFMIMDAANLPNGSADSFGRKIGFHKMEPGWYKFTYHQELLLTEPNGPRVWATLRKVVS